MHYQTGNTPYTSAESYSDLDGNSRQFSFVDHDKKTKISVSKDDKENPVEELRLYREKLIDKILELPAVSCPDVFHDYTVRGENSLQITWNENMLKDGGMPLNRLMDLHTLCSNRLDLYGVR